MHMVVIGFDLIRMDMNRPMLSQRIKDMPDGFWTITKLKPPAAAGAQPIADCLLEELYDMTDMDVHKTAAVIATILVVSQMGHQPHLSPIHASVTLPVFEYDTEGSPEGDYDFTGALFKTRYDLVTSHTSIPMILDPILCKRDWLLSDILGWMGAGIMVTAAAAVVLATIACSSGVLLVAIAGLVQAAAVALLSMFVLDGIPKEKPPKSYPMRGPIDMTQHPPDSLVGVEVQQPGVLPANDVARALAPTMEPKDHKKVDLDPFKRPWDARESFYKSRRGLWVPLLRCWIVWAVPAFLACLFLAVFMESGYASSGMCMDPCKKQIKCLREAAAIANMPGFDDGSLCPPSLCNQEGNASLGF